MTLDSNTTIIKQFSKIDDLVDNGLYTEASTQIEENMQSESTIEGKLYLNILKCKLTRLNGDFKSAIEGLTQLNSQLLTISDNILKLGYYVELLWSLRLNGDMQEAYTQIKLSEDLIEVLDTNSDKFIHDKLLVLKADFLHNKAVVYLEQEDIALALYVAYESLNLRKKVGKIQGISDSLNNIGVMHWYKGEMETATENLQECLQLRKKIGNVHQTALALLNLVQMNVQIGQDQMIVAKRYLDEFKTLCEEDKTENVQGKNYFKFATAVYLKGSNRFKHRVEAEKLFYDLIEKDQLDTQHTFFVYYYLAELLLFELKTTGDEGVFEEIRLLTDNLANMGKEKKMQVIMSRSHLLQSKLKIIEGNITDAKKCLTEALNIAVKANDNRLLQTITNEYDYLFEKKEELEMINSNTPFEDRIEAANLENLVTQFVERRITSEKTETEKPIMFLIMVDIGTLVYSKSFDFEAQVDENLISNFISAINDFGNQIFESTGYIERINHKNYTILMKSEGTFVFSYVFEGPSYSPSIRLNEISNQIMNLNYFKNTNFDNRIIRITSDVKDKINNVVGDLISISV